MMKKIAGVARCVVFLTILMLVLGTINEVLQPNYTYVNADWPSSTTYNQFYRMEKNTVDVLFMGSSVCINAFSPMQLYRDHGIRSYNLGSEQQGPFLSYFWLKEALRYQKPKVVVIDALFCCTRYDETVVNTTDGMVRKCLDAMRLSPVKIEAIRTLCSLDEKQDKMSYYLKNLQYHDRWKNLNAVDFDRSERAYSKLMGYAPGRDNPRYTYKTFDPKDPTAVSDAFHELSMEYMDKMAVLCKENGIEMIFVNIPGDEIDDGKNNRFNAFAKKHGIDFYNFSETSLYQTIGAKLPEESIVLHSNLKGAAKLTAYMGNLLVGQYGIKGVKDEQWEKNLTFYENFIRMEELPSIDDAETYLATLPREDCTIFMTVKDDAYTGMTDGVKEELQKLGLHTQWNEEMYRQPYLAILSSGKIIEGAKGYQGHSDRFEGGRYDLLSIGYQDGNVASIKINGEEQSVNQRGLNIVVYSHYLNRVVDSVNFDMHGGTGTALRKE